MIFAIQMNTKSNKQNQIKPKDSLYWLNKANSQEVSINADIAQLSRAEKMAKEFLQKNHVDKEETYFIVLSMNEALINIIQHTYKHQQNGKIDIAISKLNEKIVIRIRDYGPKKDPKQFRGRKLNELKPHGLGLHLIRSFMDEVKFLTDHPIGTEMVLIKKISHKKTIDL